MRKEMLVKIMSHLFSALVTVSLFFTIAATTLCATVLNKDYVFYTLDKSGYSEHLCDDVISKLKTLSAASGVEESFFETAVDKQQVKAETTEYINIALAGGNTSEYRETVRKNFEKSIGDKLVEYAEGQGFEIGETVNEALMHLASVCADYYAKFVSGNIMGTLFMTLGTVSEKLMKPVLLAIGLLAVITAVSLVFARRLDRQNVTKSLIATGITSSIIPIAAVLSRVTQRLGVEGAGMKAFFSGYIGVFVIIFAVWAVVLFLLAGLNYYLITRKGSVR